MADEVHATGWGFVDDSALDAAAAIGDALSKPLDADAKGSSEAKPLDADAKGSAEAAALDAEAEGEVLAGAPPSKGETGIRPSPHTGAHFEYPA